MDKTQNNHSREVPLEADGMGGRSGLTQKRHFCIILGKEKKLRRIQIKFEGGGRKLREFKLDGLSFLSEQTDQVVYFYCLPHLQPPHSF